MEKTDKSLKKKAVSIKGKSYVLVSDRVLYFNEEYPEGQIVTALLTAPEDSGIAGKSVVFRATVSPDGKRTFTGYSQAIVGDGMVNKTAALENAETSAVGRALAMMGIGVIESIASADEVNKATSSTGTRSTMDVYVPCQNPKCTQKANLKHGKLCYSCSKAVKGGAVIASPSGPVPDGPNGEPW